MRSIEFCTASAVFNCGDFAGERDELSDVDRFLEAMLGESS